MRTSVSQPKHRNTNTGTLKPWKQQSRNIIEPNPDPTGTWMISWTIARGALDGISPCTTIAHQLPHFPELRVELVANGYGRALLAGPDRLEHVLRTFSQTDVRTHHDQPRNLLHTSVTGIIDATWSLAPCITPKLLFARTSLLAHLNITGGRYLGPTGTFVLAHTSIVS